MVKLRQGCVSTPTSIDPVQKNFKKKKCYLIFYPKVSGVFINTDREQWQLPVAYSVKAWRPSWNINEKTPLCLLYIFRFTMRCLVWFNYTEALYSSYLKPVYFMVNQIHHTLSKTTLSTSDILKTLNGVCLKQKSIKCCLVVREGSNGL